MLFVLNTEGFFSSTDICYSVESYLLDVCKYIHLYLIWPHSPSDLVSSSLRNT